MHKSITEDQMKQILVTGARGQLGWEIEGLSYTHAFKGYRFHFTDLETLDVSDKESVKSFFSRNQVDYVINCAAYTDVDKAEEEPENASRINAGGVANLMDFVKKQEAVMLHISTDYVFDGKSFKPYAEDDLPNPQTVYGRTKLEGEKICLDYAKSIVVRTSWLYSEVGKNFPAAILRLAEEKNDLRVVFDQVGSPTYARDLARALLDIILVIEMTPHKAPYGVFHYANEGVCSWYDFARAILRIAGKYSKILPVTSEEFKRAAKRPAYSVLNKSKIKSTFQLSIPHWEDSLILCMNQLENKNNTDDEQ
jgi:dTDP-4-dehydrorhamnose reductase